MPIPNPEIPDPRPVLLLISGPTGTGKSRVAAAVARRLGGEIINADSIQIYRGLDIGSAKPKPEIRAAVPHHLYDRLDPNEHLDVAGWTSMADDVIGEIASRGKTPMIVGGTNFYLRALLRGLPELPPRQPVLRRRLEEIMARPRGIGHLHRLLRSIDPVSGARIERADRHRIERAIEVYAASGKPISTFQSPAPTDPPRYPHLQFALSLERSELTSRLDRRVEAMYESGLVDEVRSVIDRFGSDLRPLSSIGYREASDYLQERSDLDTAIELTKRRTRAYARRQMTWLRAEQDVQWVDAAGSVEEMAETITRTFLQFQTERNQGEGQQTNS